MSKRKKRKAATKDEITARVRDAALATAGKKAFRIDILEVGALTSIADYFIICSTTSERQSNAVADAVEESVWVEHRVKPLLTEGRKTGRWILLDFGDFVVHVFTEECRRFYALERLWGDAPNLASEILGEPSTIGA